MMEKIELVKSMHKMVDGVKVYRIRALKSFYPRHLQCNEVKKGDLGGYAQYLLNLSEEGNCWIAENAAVYGMAKVKDNALVTGNAIVCGNSTICEEAAVRDYAKISGKAIVAGHSKVFGNAELTDEVCIGDHINVFGNAKIYGKTVLSGNAFISD